MNEPPYVPFYKPYGMSDEEYSHEVRLAEERLAQWEEEQTEQESLKTKTMNKSKGQEQWNYRMFNDANDQFSCIIQNQSGDNICKMLRSDAPNNAMQEEYAKIITAAPDLLEACQQAVFALPTDHAAFETVRAAIKKALGASEDKIEIRNGNSATII